MKKDEKITTWGDILKIIQKFNEEELKKPVTVAINSEFFNPEHTLIADKKIEIGLITNKEKEGMIFIGNTERLVNSKQYTFNYIHKLIT